MSRRESRLPESIGGGVRQELDRLGGGPDSRMAEIVSQWPALVGETIARNAWPARHRRDGTLVVHTGSSAWAHELAQLEAMVMERLGVLAPARLRFVVGVLPERGGEPATTSRRSVHNPDMADREKALKIALAIEDPALREAAKEAISRALAGARAARPDRGV